MKQVMNTAPPSNIIGINDVGVTNLIGVKHRNFNAESNPKKYKVHQRADSGEIELVGFLNSTGHLREEAKFDSMEELHNYCDDKGHSMYIFDTPQEFGTWLAE